MQVSGEKERPHRRIVVGVDGSASSMAALRWALGQAETTGAEVAAVYAWKYPMSFGAPIPLLPDVDIAAEAGTALAAAIAQATAGETGVMCGVWSCSGIPPRCSCGSQSMRSCSWSATGAATRSPARCSVR
jgi:hypothetical protein